MAHDDEKHTAAGTLAGARPLWTAAAIIYGTFLLLILTIPQSLVSWLRDMDGNPVQEVVLRGAETVQAASHKIGLDAPYVRARAAFFALTGKEDN